MYKHIIRPILFKFDPEKVHHFMVSSIKVIFNLPGAGAMIRSLQQVEDKRLERVVMGLKFKNPVGLAAGLDKNADVYNEFADLGFGFIEIGTVTPKAQDGNPPKRLFRLIEDEAIINRMGFNNGGALKVVKKLKKNKGKVIIGGNIGKNTGIPEQQITDDYLTCFRTLFDYVDYFVVNVSCPNVGVTAKLQDKAYLIELLSKLQSDKLQCENRKPIVLKISPDLNDHQLDEIIEVVRETKIDGVIACNTSTNRTNLSTSNEKLNNIGNGGLSGKPIADRSNRVIKYLADHSQKAFAIIGVGGIHSEEDALRKMKAGADLVQIYTGFIYEGPGLIKRINKALLK
ncbi:quinone-dependent dihydroorotate dehydrogenase [Saccharicrinis fermentans]|uniref:Dihydroorotate dehydrogenase (quinone) n=1 Tax=Saccharicrinis fermentans DSM 9555 = JCM 21142 TaxID=869213 RepID=W7YIM2_9BACT|nr:quinone-dependent dihydroorotate dehydrogenase [Saccharicrinis fermentans]GAF02389.1 dihydroorotate dehydrogenase [Saccharicrinis fermentans DSM 9555 = JCM 21142]